MIHGVIYTPADFDPSRRYPVVDYIYGGPWISAVQKEYAPTMGMHRIPASLAQMGLVVVMVDGRGTPGRDKAFQDATYGRIGQMEIADQVAALRAAAESRPWMDLSRAGIAGHSWGGYFALRGMLTAPEFFRAGYAGAPGDLTELAAINEPHMGMPAENPAGYERGSNIPLAANLAGPLKIMHGTSDVNAPFSTTMRMISALIAADRRFDLLVIPGGPHNPPDPAGRFYRQDLRRFMATQLQGIGNREQGIGNSLQRLTPMKGCYHPHLLPPEARCHPEGAHARNFPDHRSLRATEGSLSGRARPSPRESFKSLRSFLQMNPRLIS